MKRLSSQTAARGPLRPGERGMTLVEMMFAMGLVGVVVGGILSANFLGLRESRLMESKAGASDAARLNVNRLLYDIRAAKGFDIGSVSGTNFIAITNGALQGMGLKLYPVVVSTNQLIDPRRYILYYFDDSQAASGNGKLWRLNSTNGIAAVVVSNLTQTLFFTAENYLGNTQTVRSYKNVIHATLQFTQFQYPLTPIGTNGLFDYYRIDCRATPHIPDGA